MRRYLRGVAHWRMDLSPRFQVAAIAVLLRRGCSVGVNPRSIQPVSQFVHGDIIHGQKEYQKSKIPNINPLTPPRRENRLWRTIIICLDGMIMFLSSISIYSESEIRSADSI